MFVCHNCTRMSSVASHRRNHIVMKKNFYCMFLALLATVLCIGFTGCSSDDDDLAESEVKTSIVGTWETTHYSGYTYDDTKEENIIKVDQDIPDDDLKQRISFTEDGIYTWYYYYRSRWNIEDSDKYEVKGNTLRLYYSDDDEEPYEDAKIVSINSKTMVVESHLEEGSKYTYRVTLKRVD